MATAVRDITDMAHDSLRFRFRQDVLVGLSQERKAIPARWLYDRRGSELFEEITHLREYYPTRTETGILMAHATGIGRAIGPEPRVVVEFGAGSVSKTPLLLDVVQTAAYVPIDISGEFLRDSCRMLAIRYPDLPIHPLEADFSRPITLSAEVGLYPRVGFFPGSTIGNLEPMAATDLLRSMRRTLGAGSLLVIGFDRVKSEHELIAAYDDEQGVTAAFNLNLAMRINHELEAEIPLDALAHTARWNDDCARIEMHLLAKRDLAFEVCGSRFTMAKGETIHTENSHKYDPRSAATLLLAGGWEPFELYGDTDGKFMVMLARAIGDELAP